MLTLDGDSDVTHGGRRHAVTGDTLVQIVRVTSHVTNHNRLAWLLRYTCHNKHIGLPHTHTVLTTSNATVTVPY